MNAREWSTEEFEQAVAFHLDGVPAPEIGRRLNRTESSVRLKLISKGISSRRMADTVTEAPPSPETPEVLPEPPASPYRRSVETEEDLRDHPLHDEALRFIEARERRLEIKRQRDVAAAEILQDRLVEVFEEALRDCRLDIQVEPPKTTCVKEDASSLCVVVSDTHVGKVTNPNESQGLANYDPAMSVARLHLLEQEVLRMIKLGPPLDEIVVLFGGDIVEGALDHGAEREESLLISKQFALSTSLFSQFLFRLCSAAPSVRVYGVSGNHGRWPGQRKTPTVGRESNLDGLVYSALEQIATAAKVPNIRFDLRDSARQLIDVRGTLIHLAHGDELRGGEFFTAGIKREVHHALLRYAPEGQIPDLWVVGDKHISMTVPAGHGAFLINGSFVGEDAFSLRFAPSPPSQTAFWICSERGKYLQSQIRLDRARRATPLPYSLSPALQDLVGDYIDN